MRIVSCLLTIVFSAWSLTLVSLATDQVIMFVVSILGLMLKQTMICTKPGFKAKSSNLEDLVLFGFTRTLH